MNNSLKQLEYFEIYFPSIFQTPLLQVFAGKMGTNSTCSRNGENSAIASIRINETSLNITKNAIVQMPEIMNVSEVFFSLKDLQNGNSCLLGPLLNDSEVQFYPVYPALKLAGPEEGAGKNGIDLYMILFYCLLGFTILLLMLLVLYLVRRRKRQKAFMRKFRNVLGRSQPENPLPPSLNEPRSAIADAIIPLARRASSGPSVLTVAKDPNFETSSVESSSSFHTGNEPSIKSEDIVKTSASMNSFHTASLGTTTTDSYKTADSFTYESDMDADLPEMSFDGNDDLEVDKQSIVTVDTIKAASK